MYQRASAKLAKQWRAGTVQGHGQAYLKMLSATTVSVETWNAHKGKVQLVAVTLFHLFIFLFFFPANFCTLLVLDTGHLRIQNHTRGRTKISEPVGTQQWWHSDLYSVWGDAKFASPMYNIPQCHHFVTGPQIYMCLVSHSQPHSPVRRNVFLCRTYAAPRS